MKLSSEHRKNLLSDFFLALEPLEYYVGALNDAGLLSFLAWYEFEEACCINEIELAALPNYRLEYARARFTPPDLLWEKGSYERVQCLRPWKDRYDGKNGVLLLHLEDARKKKFEEYRQSEYESWRGFNAVDSEPFDSFVEYFTEKMLDAFGKLGFCFDPKRSAKGFPVFSKPLVADWSICWAAVSKNKLNDCPRSPHLDSARWTTIGLQCYVSNANTSGEVHRAIKSQNESFIVLKIEQLVRGFGWSYSRVNGLDQVGFCIDAYSRLYSIFAQKIEIDFANLLRLIL